MTKKGLNLALFWSKLYKHIILQRYFYKFDEFVLIETNTVIKLTFFFDNLKVSVLEIAFSVPIFAFIEVFLGKNRKNTVVFVCCRLCFVFFLGYKAAFVEILSMKTGLMHWPVDSPRDSFCFVDG